MKKFDKITIVGVGLIGGSIGLAIKEHKMAREVVGVFRRRSTMKKAIRRKAVDRGVMSIADGVNGADLIIIASPVNEIPPLACEAAAFADPGAIVTDAGSTKAWIVNKMDNILDGYSVKFVGSHPMAGSEKTGVEFSRSDLFENSACIVTKTSRTDTAALKKIVFFWKSLGARVKVLSPSEHDRAVSLVSHLPHIVAFGLAGAVPEKVLDYAAEGFKDTTRIASSDPELWAGIFLTNRSEIARSAKIFRTYYARILDAIAAGDHRRVIKALDSAKRKRDTFLRKIEGEKR